MSPASSSGGVSAPEREYAHAPWPAPRGQEEATCHEMHRMDKLLVEQGLRGFFHDYNHRMVRNSKGASPQFCGPGLGVGYF